MYINITMCYYYVAGWCPGDILGEKFELLLMGDIKSIDGTLEAPVIPV